MSITYLPTTNFGAKDSLPTNDPDKVIKGSEFTTEFTAIQSAFSQAAPTASPTFTGTATFASVDVNGGAIDNTTIGATTPAAATFSALTANTGGFASTFNRTSLGLTVNVQFNGVSIGGITSAASGGGNYPVFHSTSFGVLFAPAGMFPTNGVGVLTDNVYDIAGPSFRFNDAYVANGVTKTSDANEKQDIAELDAAERRVAVACKGLLRKYRWKNMVAEKGDAARIHFGIVAQDLEAAFAAEGLDAGRYGMFMSDAWIDETTGEQRTRKGVRYDELLAFIIAAL